MSSTLGTQGGTNVHLAYIDGGTGSMALQLLLAGVLSGVYAVHTRWDAFKKYLARKHRSG
ncbi:MAG: hypothetical protein ACHQ50_14520 [Fimbriimonadales bacterium]